MTKTVVGNADFGHKRNPGLAPLLSLLPGLGQIYNGQARKGLLFLATTISYLLVFALMAFNRSIIDGLTSFGQAVHMSPNSGLTAVLSELHLGSSVSFIVVGLFGAFVFCAMRDAQEHANVLKNKHIYGDYAMEINEAATGSYLLHFVGIVVLFIMAVFLFKQSHPAQITYIEFVPSQLPVQKVVNPQFKSDHKSDSSGIHKSQPIAPSSHKQATDTVVKAAQPSERRVVLTTPKLNPTINNKMMSLPVPQQRVITNPVSPFLHNVENKNLTVPHPFPQAINNAVDLPKPSLANSSKSGQALIAPKLLNSNSVNNVVIDSKGPIPVSTTGADKYAPVPEKMGSRSSSQNSANNNLPNIGPTKASNYSGLPPGMRVKPAVGDLPFVPAAGIPRAGTRDNMQGNPVPNSKAQEADSLAALPVNFGPYMNDLQRRIKQNWFPPKDTESKQIKVGFKIHQHGELTDLHILKSSGLSRADQAALKAVENAAPFRSLPAGASENIDVEFTFDYNVFNGGSAIFKQF